MTSPAKGVPHELVLEATSPGGRARRLVLRPGQVRQIGRGARADLSIPDDSFLSDAHFSVSCDAAGGAVRDLRSSNGLFVNGERTSEARLSDGDQITAGKTVFNVRLDDGVAMPVTATPQTPVSRRSSTKRERPYTEAIRDPDARVRREALRAAALTRQPWLLEHLRAAAREPSPDSREALLLLATLAEPADVPRLLELGKDETLDTLRFELLGALGSPDGVPEVIAALGSDEPSRATAASRAFAKLTGVDVGAGERLEPTGDTRLAPDVPNPDATKAIAHWRRFEHLLRKSPRLRRGLVIESTSNLGDVDSLDLESAGDLVTRVAHFEGRRIGRVDA